MCFHLEGVVNEDVDLNSKCEVQTLKRKMVSKARSRNYRYNRGGSYNERCFSRYPSSLIAIKKLRTRLSCKNDVDSNFFSINNSRCNSNLKFYNVCDFSTTITKDSFSNSHLSKFWNLSLHLRLLLSLFICLLRQMCLYLQCWKPRIISFSSKKFSYSLLLMSCFATLCTESGAYSNHFDKTDKLLEKVNLEQSIAAVFNKVAYGSTTKRSIPDNSYPVTTLATPLLTTYRYSDGSDEWLRVDVKNSDDRPNYDDDDSRRFESGYGSDLEKDHALPTSAPAADILKNNNNKNYNNPNRYNNDRLRPDFELGREEPVTEDVSKTTSSYISRNVRPTKSIYSKNVPSYVPPNRDFFTPPLPPQYINPFADKPTLRGTNSDSFANRRPIPPPSLMPNKDRIPFRPDLPPNKVNMEKNLPERPEIPVKNYTVDSPDSKTERKKTLNTPSQNYNLDRLGDYYGSNRNLNETSFEYEKAYIPTITRILSGSNGRHEDISEILLKSVTATPHVQRSSKPKTIPIDNFERSTKMQDSRRNKGEENSQSTYDESKNKDESFLIEENDKIDSVVPFEYKPPDKPEGVTSRKEVNENGRVGETTVPSSDVINLANVKGKESKESKISKASSDEVWLICWNVHVYLVVFVYIILAIFSIYKLVRYEHDPHMFSKSYFLTIHLLLTIICVLRIFYLAFDPYNIGKSFDTFLYEFLHNFPLSLLGTTFAVLILFLLKRTLNHLKVKTRPIFLVVFAIMHILLCFCLSLVEALGYFEKASLIICKPVFVLLAWALGFSYLYLYKIIKNVLAKKTQNLSEICTQNISYASHITIAVALLFILLGFVQLYALFFIKVDRFNLEVKHHWILWGFELSVRVLEIAIITLLAVVVSLKMSQREKQTVGFPLFPCTTSDSSADNIFPNNCTTNPNASNYTRNEMILDNVPAAPIERPNLLKHVFQNESFDKKSTLERYRQEDADGTNFDRFEHPKWGSERFEVDQLRQNVDQTSLNSFGQTNSINFERAPQNSLRKERNSGRKTYDGAKYYAKPRYDLEFNEDDGEFGQKDANVYSEPVDNQYDRTRLDFERNNFDRRSKNSSNTSGRRSTGRTRKNHARPHLGVQTLPGHEVRHQIPDTMLVDDQGFVRFRHLQDIEHEKLKKKYNNDLNHYSDA